LDSTKSLARRAGWLYLLQCQPAPFAYLYVPNRLLVPGDVVATFERVRASEGLLRAAVMAELLSATLSVFALVAFYRLFRRVDRNIALIFAAMMLASVPISFVNTLFNIAPLVLIKNHALATALGAGPMAGLVTLFLRIHGFGVVVNQIFWGLWLFPYGILVMRSGFIPRWLGYPLFAAGAAYLLNTLGALLLPPEWRWISNGVMVLGVGELPIIVWLLVWGARPTTAREDMREGEVALDAG
jgi:uncharacterized protein DUF4386